MAQKNGGPNLVRRLIAVGASGAPTQILATGPCRGWRIQESVVTTGNAAQASQGFECQIPNDGTANGFSVWFARPLNTTTAFSPNDNYFENWNQISEHGPYGEVFAGPGGALGAGIGTTTATLLCNAQSLTATATTLEIVEYF